MEGMSVALQKRKVERESVMMMLWMKMAKGSLFCGQRLLKAKGGHHSSELS